MCAVPMGAALWYVSTEPRISSASKYAVRCTVRFVAHRIIWTPQNTNVVELYKRLQKNKRQLTYYDSGIGTYVKETFSIRAAVQFFDYAIDMAIAW